MLNKLISMLKHHIESALAPLVGLIDAIDAAELHDLALPLEMPGLIERFLDPEIQLHLPDFLRPAAAAYLEGLPGFRAGDVHRAAAQHALRVELWLGKVQAVDEAEIAALGLDQEENHGGCAV